MNEKQKLEFLRTECGAHLEEIAELLDKPHEAKLTLLVRCPWLADGSFVVSNDDHERAAKEILDLHERNKQPKVMMVPSKMRVLCGNCFNPQTATIGGEGWTADKLPACSVCGKEHLGVVK